MMCVQLWASIWLACEVQGERKPGIWLRDKQGWGGGLGGTAGLQIQWGQPGGGGCRNPHAPLESRGPFLTNSQIRLLCDLVVQSLGIYSK